MGPKSVEIELQGTFHEVVKIKVPRTQSTTTDTDAREKKAQGLHKIQPITLFFFTIVASSPLSKDRSRDKRDVVTWTTDFRLPTFLWSIFLCMNLIVRPGEGHYAIAITFWMRWNLGLWLHGHSSERQSFFLRMKIYCHFHLFKVVKISCSLIYCKEGAS